MAHPAKFTDVILERAAPYLRYAKRALDPFSGTGKAALIQIEGSWHLNELEQEWAMEAMLRKTPNPVVISLSDARNLLYSDGYFDAVFTSPTYGNRMADHHNAKDGSRRHTYTHSLGHALSPGNSGVLQWGEEYRNFHEEAWQEVYRVLKPGGIFLLNVSDHIRNGQRQMVSNWHCQTVQSIGFILTDIEKIETPRQRHGANGDLRVPFEFLLVFRKDDAE